MTRTEAIAAINQELREDGTHYDFDGLKDRLITAYHEAIEDGEDFVTIKIPGSYEIDFLTDSVGVAFGYGSEL